MNNIGSVPAGLVINRPTKIAVSHLFPDLENLARVEDKVYFGGPVALESIWFIVRADSPPQQAIRVLDGVYLSNDRRLLRELLVREKPMEGLRIFIGYAGWGPGQLEGEIARGDWTLAPADAGAIFERKAERPWPETPESDGGRRT
jgi:putative transcriptional regulator